MMESLNTIDPKFSMTVFIADPSFRFKTKRQRHHIC